MHIGPSFIAHPQPAKLVKPGERALDHSARQAQMAAVTGKALADLWFDPTLAQDPPIRFTVVATVSLHALRFAQRSSALASNGRKPIQQWHGLCRVVTIRFCENDIQRRTGGIDEEVVLAARLAPISRAITCFFPHARPAPTNCQQSRARNRCGWRGAAWPAERDAACPRHLPLANRVRGASRSFLSRIPFPGAAAPMATRLAE